MLHILSAIKYPTAIAVSTVMAVLVGMIVYAAALLLIKGLTEEELHSFPKGELLIRIAKKFRLL